MVTTCRPRKPLRFVEAHTRRGPVPVGVWAERNGLAISTSVGPARGYSITHVPTGCKIGGLYGLTWRACSTAFALMADAFPWALVQERIFGDDYEEDLWDFVETVYDMVTSEAH